MSMEASMDVASLIRPGLRALRPYRAARHDAAEGILLDANENALCDDAELLGVRINRYPDPLQIELRRRLARLSGCALDQVMAGSGADEVIDLMIRLFCSPAADAVAVAEPTYGMYRVAAEINDVAVESVRLDDAFRLDPASAVAGLGANVKLFFCCSPNNPTGSVLPRATVVELCRLFRGIVVVDEAYIEFADIPSLADLVATTPNLVLLRTLSKGAGLAGLRIGWAIAAPTIVEHLLRIKLPYNIGALNAAAAIAALDRPETIAARIALIRRERERLAGGLRGLPIVDRVWPSQGNFLLACVADAGALCRHLSRHGVTIRDRSDEPALAGCVRVTVGTPEQNDLLLELVGRMRR